MNTVFFSQLPDVRVPLADLAREYAQWILGEGKFRVRRSTRLAQGLPESLTSAAVLRGGTFSGRFDFALASRRDDAVFVLRLSHRDDADVAVIWHNFVRVVSTGTDHCTVEHAVCRTAHRDVVLTPIAACPRVLKEIARMPAAGTCEGFRGKHVDLTAELVDDFLKYEALGSGRRRPLVIVAPRNADDAPSIDPRTLADQLFGLASVAVLADKAAARAWTDSLSRRGFEERFGCYDGAVRLYAAPLLPSDAIHAHPLFLRSFLESLPEAERSRTLGGLIGQRIVRGATPPTFFTLIEDFDRSTQRAMLQKLVSAAPAASFDEARARIKALEQLVADSNELVAAYSQDAKAAKEELLRAQLELQEAHDARDQMAVERDAKSLVISELNQRMSVISAPHASSLAENARRILTELGERVAPGKQLEIVELLYPDRLIVLDSARKSAESSEDFTFPKQSFRLLNDLADKYWSTLANGKSDAEARKIFGKSYAATESESVQANAGAMKKRTFTYDGNPTKFLAHLKIGNKDSVAETLRIHFLWDATKRQIVVAHCGSHLDFF